MTKYGRICVLVGAVVWVAASGDAPQAARSHNRLASNRLASNRLASNRLASNRLASNALSSTRLEATAAAAELLSTPEGREVYYYLISCALPAGVSIQAEVPDAADIDTPGYGCTNGTCTFRGALGLADYWANHKLSPQGQRWVSACMFARVNAFETAEGISLRGPHDSLTVDEAEARSFTLQEGAFFGNLFGDGLMDCKACKGKDQKFLEDGGLVLRDCAEEDPANPGKTMCGFNYAGDCANFSPGAPEPYSCRGTDDAGNYDDCHAMAGDGHWPGLRTYREVITTYVAPGL
jgi:hypothetical protein